MTDRELFIKALDALEWNLPVIQDYGDKEQLNIQHNAINALHEKLEQPEQGTGNLLKDAYNAMAEKKTRSQKLREAGFTRRPKGWEKEKDEQEPVAWMVYTQDGQSVYVTDNPTDIQERQQALPLYATPPQRPWVGLTDDEIIDLIHPLVMADMAEQATDYEIARAIEAKLKEKNT